MKFNIQQAFRALILLAFSAFIIKLHYTGEILKFINPKYELLSQIAAVLFLFLFLVQLQRIWTQDMTVDEGHHHDHSCGHDHGTSPFTLKKVVSYSIIVFPLLTGFTLPPKTLDASIAAKKGTMFNLSSQAQAKSEDSQEEINLEAEIPESSDPITHQEVYDGSENTLSQKEFDSLLASLEKTDFIEMNDYVFSSFYEEIHTDLSKFKGKKLQLKGFVYKEEGLPENSLVISRFLVTHCVADASIIGFLTEFEDAGAYEQDTWVEAEGVLDTTTYNGMELPVLKITKVKTIEEPSQPYVYPITVKLL